MRQTKTAIIALLLVIAVCGIGAAYAYTAYLENTGNATGDPSYIYVEPTVPSGETIDQTYFQENFRQGILYDTETIMTEGGKQIHYRLIESGIDTRYAGQHIPVSILGSLGITVTKVNIDDLGYYGMYVSVDRDQVNDQSFTLYAYTEGSPDNMSRFIVSGDDLVAVMYIEPEWEGDRSITEIFIAAALDSETAQMSDVLDHATFKFTADSEYDPAERTLSSFAVTGLITERDITTESLEEIQSIEGAVCYPIYDDGTSDTVPLVLDESNVLTADFAAWTQMAEAGTTDIKDITFQYAPAETDPVEAQVHYEVRVPCTVTVDTDYSQIQYSYTQIQYVYGGGAMAGIIAIYQGDDREFDMNSTFPDNGLQYRVDPNDRTKMYITGSPDISVEIHCQEYLTQ